MLARVRATAEAARYATRFAKLRTYSTVRAYPLLRRTSTSFLTPTRTEARLNVCTTRPKGYSLRQCAPLSTGMVPTLSSEDHLEVAENHLDILLNSNLVYSKELAKIRAASEQGESVLNLWQAAMNVFLLSQIHVISPYGYSQDMEGLTEFNKSHHEAIAGDQGKELKRLFNDRWNAVIEQAFGFSTKDGPGLTVDQARHYSGTLAFRMQSEEFLKQIDTATADLSASGSEEEIMQQKQVAVMSVLQPLQQEIAAQFGFDGPDSFIRLQAAMMEHALDDQILYNMSSSTMAVFRRAGIPVPGQ